MNLIQPNDCGMKEYAESKRLIRKAMNEKQLVLFVGAGASIKAGMPSWSDAVKIFANKLNVEANGSDNTLLPQYYFNSRGNKEYTQLSREVFRFNEKLIPNEVHSMILRFNAQTIITTNYDHLLELAAEDNGEFLQVISQDVDLPYRKDGKELIKIHGDFEHNNFVLKEDDYLHYHKNFKLIENYVKSLIGTKMVLFIGYGFNDPDIKHIFSWVKEVLNEHFQSAYMIVTGKSKDQNEVEYYRHLGINLIYSTVLFDNKDIGIDDHFLQLQNTLYFLLKDDEERKGIIDTLYESLKPFNSINYTYRKYIESAVTDVRKKFSDKYSLWLDTSNYIVLDKNKASDDLSYFMYDFVNYCKNGTDEVKIQSIINSLKNSSVNGVIITKSGDFTHNDETYELFNGFSEPEWFKTIYLFDYKKLYEIRENNSKLLNESNPELYMQQAYISAILLDYYTAFNCLSIAAKAFYKKQDYAWFFIALWNKRRVAFIICRNPYLYENLDKEVLESIRFELENNDIEQTLATIPDLGNQNNQFLKDLIDFKFASDLFIDVFSSSIKSLKQASDTYLWFAGMPAYEQMRQQVYDYYKYVVNNYLIVDSCRENIFIFNLFARSIFSSAISPDKDMELGAENFELKNIHAENLTDADIHLIFRYINCKDLKKLFKEIKIDIINVSQSGKDYLNTIINSWSSSSCSKNFQLEIGILDSYLCFIAHTKIDTDLAKSTLHFILGIDDFECWLAIRESIIEFINSIFKQCLYNNSDICQETYALAKKLLMKLISDEKYNVYLKNIILDLFAFSHKGGICFVETEVINQILSEKYESLLPVIYKFSNQEIKSLIDIYFTSLDNSYFFTRLELYSDLVIIGVIEKNEIIETKALDSLEQKNNQKKNEIENGMFTLDKNSLENALCNLYLSNQIINVDRLRELFSSSTIDFYRWIIDVNSFDYSKFKLSWLTSCTHTMLEELAANNLVKTNIVSVFRDKYRNAFIDNRIIEIVVKYFL